MKFINYLFLSTLLTITGITTVQAEEQTQGQRCGSRIGLIQQLTNENYKEYPKFLGLINENAVMELFINEEKSTWTMFVTKADGTSCLVSAGDDLKLFDSPKLNSH